MTREQLGTTWPAEPHTLAKIAILRAYLHVWFSVMGRAMGRRPLLYVDGFAGPGAYAKGEKGSPLAAIEAAKAARAMVGSAWAAGTIHCAFIESEPERLAHLMPLLKPFTSEPGIDIHTYQASFLDGLAALKKDLPSAFPSQWPRFVFLDPFGATGIPFAVVRELLSSPRSEVLINLDADGIQRILRAGEAAAHERILTEIFGDESWRTAIDPSADTAIQHVQVLQLYKERLRSIPKVRYAWAFEMAKSTRKLEYYLVFASQHPLGLEKMKEAMKRMAQGGEYRFNDRRVRQPELDLFRSDDPAPWGERLKLVYAGTQATYDELRDFALNETPFLNPKSMLRYLDANGAIEVIPRDSVKVKKGTFPEEKIDHIRFRA